MHDNPLADVRLAGVPLAGKEGCRVTPLTHMIYWCNRLDQMQLICAKVCVLMSYMAVLNRSANWYNGVIALPEECWR